MKKPKEETIFICKFCAFQTKSVYEMLTHMNEEYHGKESEKRKLPKEKESVEKEFKNNILIACLFFAIIILAFISVALFRNGGL